MLLIRKVFQLFAALFFAAAASQAQAAPESGWWWNEAEGGRGFAIEVQNGVMFMSGFMYDDAGRPIWYVSGPAPMLNANLYRGNWLQFGGGQTLNGPYHAATVTNSNVGNVQLAFSSPTTATMTLPSGATIPLTRFNFSGAPPTPTGPIAATCTSANINVQKYNAITLGMTPDQVTAVLGCKNDPSRTQRNSLFTAYVWGIPGSFSYIGVYFDTSVTQVIDVYNGAPGTTPSYKFANGI